MKRALLLFFLLQSFLTFSQEKKVENYYVDYFKLPRESLFLHTNKTSYISGEEIWFKVYAYDRINNLSSKATTNIYLGIYNDLGKQINKKLFLAKDGIASGSIAIDSTFTTGSYYLKTYTNWMKNFKEDDSYIQKIEIINPDIEETLSKKVTSREYDVQFLPEGGYLLSDVNNSVGVKTIDDTGKGTKARGILLNSKDEEITSFKTNFLGLGKFSFIPKEGEKYKARITLDNSKELEQDLPRAETIGITMIINNLKQNQVIINLLLNEKSLESFKGKEYRALVHKDGVAKVIPFITNNKTERITIDKMGLFKGVNTVTIFDEQNRPILERMFFNDIAIKNTSIALSKKGIVRDSISYELASNFEQNQLLNVSISVLPSETKSYSPEHNIISSFYLKPYVKGVIENPQYYFTKVNRKKKYELDILLLTQGWSRYSWDNIINFPPKPNFDFENGITLNGSLNSEMKKAKSLLLYPTLLNKSKFIHFDEDGKFQVTNFYPIIGETLKFSYVDKKGRAKNPDMALSYVKYLAKDNVDVSKYEEFSSYYQNKNYIPKYFFNKEYELLDEIVLTSKLEKKKRKEYRLPYRGELITINKLEVQQFNNLSDFLNDNGFVVLQNPNTGLYTISSIKGSRDGVIMYLDNNEIRDVSSLLDRSLASYEDVFIDNNSVANNMGINREGFGFNHVIKLFSRRNSLYGTNRSREHQKLVKVNYGFQVEKDFYMPKYFSYTTKSFRENGVIHWEPNATIKNNESYILTTLNTGLDQINFCVEGITSNGDLISQIIKVGTTKK